MKPRRTTDRRTSALTRYTLRLGTLAERHLTLTALETARRQAEQEAADAGRARDELEITAACLRDEMASRLGAQARLSHLANHDVLTALPNRALFSDRLARELEGAARDRRSLALFYIDLDNFKDVNDTLGHAAGDLLLKQVAGRLEGELALGQTVARMGGDEFAILQTGLADRTAARDLAARLIETLVAPFTVQDRQLFVGASIGITLFPDDADTVELLHRNADLAMYRAKRDGRNRYHFFDRALNDELHRRSFIEQSLREPSIRSQLHVAFQPQVDLRINRVSGLEALLRWRHPAFGLISPDEFIPIAEQSGLIDDLGTWVLRESCEQAMRWRDLGVPALTVAVNVATAQFRLGNMPRLVADVLAATGLPACCLELEITETGIMHDMGVAAGTLVALHQMGVHLAIDDFGTGYSSLSYLRRLPVDRIKIDRGFVRDVPDNEDASIVVSTIVKLAHNLRLQVVAEGVETRAQADFVRSSGCAYAQGFFFGQPVSPPELPNLRPLAAASLEHTP